MAGPAAARIAETAGRRQDFPVKTLREKAEKKTFKGSRMIEQ